MSAEAVAVVIDPERRAGARLEVEPGEVPRHPLPILPALSFRALWGRLLAVLRLLLVELPEPFDERASQRRPVSDGAPIGLGDLAEDALLLATSLLLGPTLPVVLDRALMLTHTALELRFAGALLALGAQQPPLGERATDTADDRWYRYAAPEP